MELAKRNAGELPTFRSMLSDFFEREGFFDMNRWDAFNGAQIPAANITENENDYQIEIAVPGMHKDEISVSVENNVLTLNGEKKEERKEEKERYTRREFTYNSFVRSFTLPENVDEDRISAKQENGFLRLSIPKVAVTRVEQSKKIAIS